MPMPVISVAQMRAWEQATWASGQTEETVIALVGRALAARTLALTPPGSRLLLLAGKGHNGDDVRAMLPHLTNRAVESLTITDPDADLPGLQAALARSPALIVDGLFGIGLSRPLAPAWVQLLGIINASGRPVLAVDVPSGLDAATGEPQPDAIRATLTITVGAPKLGLITARAADYVGRLEVAADVGLIPCPATSELMWDSPEGSHSFPPARPAGGHKGTFGHVAIVAGSIGYHGAAVLAARGAQRARPGLVTLLPQPEVYPPVAAQTQAVMVQPWTPGVTPVGATAVLFGPGLAAPTVPASVRAQVSDAWLRAPIPVVVDASALDWLPREPVASEAPRVLTPHPGEAARLLGVSIAEVQRDRLAALRALARRFHGWIVLKGAHTLIGAQEGDVFVNGTGNSGLAQGGSGDVLAGWIAGWLAQPLARADVLPLLRHAVREHGRAADRLAAQRPNWTVEELADDLGAKA